MTRGFICDGCGNSIKEEPMLEIKMSVSFKKVSGNGRESANEEVRHYCETCVVGRTYESDGWDNRLKILTQGALVRSSWDRV